MERNNRVFGGIMAVAFFIALATFFTQEEKQDGQPIADELPDPIAVITMTPEGFSPTTTRVKNGDVVRFENKDTDWRWPASDLHPTHELYPEFDPQEPIKAGEGWSFRFQEQGSWRFHDHLKPNKRGTLVVE